jgi:hypothetical protein
MCIYAKAIFVKSLLHFLILRNVGCYGSSDKENNKNKAYNKFT